MRERTKAGSRTGKERESEIEREGKERLKRMRASGRNERGESDCLNEGEKERRKRSRINIKTSGSEASMIKFCAYRPGAREDDNIHIDKINKKC